MTAARGSPRVHRTRLTELSGVLIPPAHLPPPAGPGDRVGIAALSGPVDPAKLEAGLAALRRLGFEPVLADNVRARAGLFAGSDAERLAAFHKLAAEDDLPVIFFARGGHGLLRLLPGIDWGLLRRRPRAYVGYSDLTPFLLEVVRRLGMVAFHGPMVATDFARGLDSDEEASLLGALAGRYPAAHAIQGAAGDAEGVLLGGCLSLLVATLGTPFAPDFERALVFWEELNEPPFRVDRMLTHLRLSGNLANIAGMIVGHLGGTVDSGGEPPDWPAFLRGSLEGYSWPLAWGLESGHLAPNLTLPLGSPARLDAGGGRLVLGS